MSGKAKTVKRFERSNGLDTALYKNYLLHLQNILFLKLTWFCYAGQLFECVQFDMSRYQTARHTHGVVHVYKKE